MIIEFMGLPGVGKSYLGKQVEKELSHRGVRCISVVERSRTSLVWKVLSKCLHIVIPSTTDFKRLKEKLLSVASVYTSSQAMYNENSVGIVDYIEQVAFLDYVYAKLRASKTVYIFDEGIAQQFANMIVNFDVNVEIMQNMLELLEEKPKTVYLTYSIEKIKESIESRDRHVCYIDELRDKELDQFLISYQKACNDVSCIITPLMIDRADNSRLCLDSVIQAIIG